MAVQTTALSLWLSLLLSGTYSQDCSTYQDLPNMHERDPSVPHAESSPAICDDTLTTGWYRAGFYDMATSAVTRNRCGTSHGFYMDIPVPTDSLVHKGRACLARVYDSCYYFKNIKVKNCGQFRIYYLQSLGFCGAAYCFHLADNSSVPSYQVPKPDARFHDLEWTTVGSDRVPRLVFSCAFQPSTTEPTLHYVVTWFANETQIGSDKIVTDSTLSNGYLLEEEIVNAGFRHGITIFCSVGAQFTATSASGVRIKSDGFFAGFKVLTPSLQIQERGSTMLSVTPTVPFACENQNPDCKVYIQAEDPDMGDCQGNSLITESNRCRVNVSGKTEKTQGNYYTDEKYKIDYSLTLSHGQSEASYDKKSHYTVALKTSTVMHSFWSNSPLASIPVNIYYTNSIWRGKVCHQRGDPYFKPFERSQFDFHEEGSFLLYENMNSSQSVHIKTKPCSRGHWATCGCGVAVRAGRDVFTIFTCSGSTIIDFPVCDDGVLDARTDGDRRWKVTFPSGTLVEILMIDWPSALDLNVDVFIYPSAADENNTRGLCGYLDGQNDDIRGLIKSDGTTTSNTDEYSRSWKLSEDYFFDHQNLDKFDNLESWSKEVQFCVCPTATIKEEEASFPRLPTTELHCSYKTYIGKCYTDRSKPFECFLKTQGSKNRKRREIHTHSYNINGYSSQRKKRSSGGSYVVSETDAKEQCETTFNSSVTSTECSENIAALTTSFLDSCISDYRITGQQFVVTASLDALKGTCLSILEKDVELQSTNPTFAGVIFNNSCLNNCSGRGQCQNGYCACTSGFAGTDCSKNIENPPIITSINVRCDTSDGSCDTISIYGRNFLNTNSFKCEVSRKQILNDGTSVLMGSSTENGTQRSPFEAICPLPKTVTSNTFVYTYNVSISNDGISYSNISEVFVFNSLCQEMIDSSGTTIFNLRTGFCFINESCMPDGLKNPENSCQQCVVTNDTFNWNEITDCQTTTVVSSSETSQTTENVATGTQSTDTVSTPVKSSISTLPTSTSQNTYSTNHVSNNSALPTSTSQSTASTNSALPKSSSKSTASINSALPTSTSQGTASTNSALPTSTSQSAAATNSALPTSTLQRTASTNSALPTSTSQSTASTNQSPQTLPTTSTSASKGSSTPSTTSLPSTPKPDAPPQEEVSTVIIIISVCVVFGLIVAGVVTVMVVKFVCTNQQRQRTMFSSKIPLQSPHGKSPINTAFENPQDTTFIRGYSDYLYKGQQGKYMNYSRPSSAVSTRGTHLDFTDMMQPTK